MGVTGILLAAGQGSRLGGGKLLHKLASGDSIGITSYRNLCTALDHVLVVVRPNDAQLRDEFSRAGAVLIDCADALQGQSHSLIAGVHATPAGHALVVALGDMPFVQVETIRALVRSIHSGALIAAPYYLGSRGNPIAFAAHLRQELLLVSGDMGAREVVKRHAHELMKINCADPGVLRDIDTPQDLAGS
jgi:molybdenum cofactor cytidylyltransferase